MSFLGVEFGSNCADKSWTGGAHMFKIGIRAYKNLYIGTAYYETAGKVREREKETIGVGDFFPLWLQLFFSKRCFLYASYNSWRAMNLVDGNDCIEATLSVSSTYIGGAVALVLTGLLFTSDKMDVICSVATGLLVTGLILGSGFALFSPVEKHLWFADAGIGLLVFKVPSVDFRLGFKTGEFGICKSEKIGPDDWEEINIGYTNDSIIYFSLNLSLGGWF